MNYPLTALIIDDSPEIRLALSAILREQGLTVTVADSGERGLELAREQHPDLICLDLMLPVTCGIDVCRTLRATPETADTPIVIVSARPFPQDRAAAEQAGADAFVAKPLNRRLVETTVRSVIWNRHMAVGA